MTHKEIVAPSLTRNEQADLARLERVIRKHLKGFIATGNALAEIRERKLYRTEFHTFKDYCREVWDLGRSHAYRLMDCADVIKNLSPIGDKNDAENETFLPVNEAQVRPLTILNKKDQVIVWGLIKQSVLAEVEPLTARVVSQWVENFLNNRVRAELDKAEKKRKNLTAKISKEMDQSFNSFLRSIENEVNSGWEETSKEEIVLCLQTLLDVIGE